MGLINWLKGRSMADPTQQFHQLRDGTNLSEDTSANSTVDEFGSLFTRPMGADGNDIQQAVRFIDENGDAYGIKHIDNKPRVSSMPYEYDIAEGNVPDHFALRKFGHNSAVAATLEDVWDGSNVYTYLTAGEQLQVFGGANDTGNTLSTGTATGSSTISLIDAGANFVGDGVALGDIVLNDEDIECAIVSAVSATKLDFTLAVDTDLLGKAYRVVNANGTGAAVIELQGLDANWDRQREYVVLNGAADVTTVGSYVRVFRAKVELAGNTGWNVDNIDIEDNASAVLLARITAEVGQTLMALWTVPNGFTAFMTSFYASTDSNRATEIRLYIRPHQRVFNIKKILNILDGYERIPYDFPLEIPERSDIAIRAIATGGGGNVSAGFDLWYEANS